MSIIPHEGKAVYELHFDQSFLPNVKPPTLIQDFQFEFESIYRMTEISRELFGHVQSQSPDAVLFFANGGWPIGFSMMQRYMDTPGLKQYRGASRLFHVFPGLNWDTRNQVSQTTKEVFSNGLRSIIARNNDKPKLKLMAVDTTNTGHATSRIVNCLTDALESIRPSIQIDLSIFGLFGLIKQDSIEDGSIFLGEYKGQDVMGLLPESAQLEKVDGFKFKGVLKTDIPSTISIEFMPIPEIPSEDNSKMIGVFSLAKGLGLAMESPAARVLTLLPKGRSQSGSSQSLSSWFVNVISDKSPYYFDFCQKEIERPEVPQADLIKSHAHLGSKLIAQSWKFRNDVAALEQAMLLKPGKFDDAELYDACTRVRSPKLARKIKASYLEIVAAAMPAQDRAEIVGITLEYFQLSFPEKFTNEPLEASAEEKLNWWLSTF